MGHKIRSRASNVINNSLSLNVSPSFLSVVFPRSKLVSTIILLKVALSWHLIRIKVLDHLHKSGYMSQSERHCNPEAYPLVYC